MTTSLTTTATSDSAPRRRTSSAGPTSHLTMPERIAAGKAARKAVPRSVHGEWQPSTERPDPVDLLRQQAETRVPELVPIRYGRMLVSPFTFYRGAAYLMASDLSRTANTGQVVQLCGDAHLSNFGAFAAPDRRLVFSINDFDETLPGPFEWDVKRLVTSFEIAARALSFTDKEKRNAVSRVVRSYREAMAAFAGMSNLDVWYTRLDVEQTFNEYRKQAPPEEIK